MTLKKRIVYGLFFLLFAGVLPGCVATRPSVRPPDTKFLETLFRDNPGPFSHVFAHPDSFRVQVIYTRIDRRRNNQPVFTDFHYHVSSANYFYPASTVKMPVALLAMQKLNQEGPPWLKSSSPMVTDASTPWETPVYNDPMAADGNPSIAGYVRKIFLVSDNDAFNRLYEFCGQEYINTRLKFMGFDSSEIIHRLSVPLTTEQNRYTNGLRLVGDLGLSWKVEPQRSDWVRYTRNESLGNGYLESGKRINRPFDFASKNRFLLTDLHQVLRSIVFPASVEEQQQFNISPSDRSLVLKAMSQYPAESRYPGYDSAEYWDTYAKFFLYGSDKIKVNPSIRVFNKVGEAYGFVTDVAYIVDFDRKIEFMVSATIYCNADGIFNDDKYEYETLGFPFMKHIGRVLYNYEVARNRKRSPDLKAFRFDYNDKAPR